MNETFEDYIAKKGWHGHSERYVEIWKDWQRDRECLIANMKQLEQQRDDLANRNSELEQRVGSLVESRIELLAALKWLHDACGEGKEGQILSAEWVKHVASEAIAKAGVK